MVGRRWLNKETITAVQDKGAGARCLLTQLVTTDHLIIPNNKVLILNIL